MKIIKKLGKFLVFLAILRLIACLTLAPITANAAELPYPEGALIKGPGPQVYLISNGLKRWIVDEKTFTGLQLNWAKINTVNEWILSQYPAGKEIKSGNTYPDGLLIKGSTPEVYLIAKSKRRWIPDEATFNTLNLSWQNIFIINDEKLERISRGEKISSLDYLPDRPETVITETPAASAEATKIRFKFKTAGVWDASNIVFETFLEGKDNNWVSTSKPYRDISLSQEARSYTFFVRAKEKDGLADLTPANYQFTVRLSPNYHKVRISGSSVKSADYQKEKLELYNNTDKAINITGWTLEAEKKGSTYTIPQAYFIPKYNDLGFNVNLELKSDQKTIIYTQPSPLGYSRDVKSQYGFRLNKCVGYLNYTYDFNPPLPKQCPKIELTDEETNIYGQACADSAKKLSTCQLLTNDILKKCTANCQALLKEKVGYDACVANHRTDIDFLKDQWQIYIGATNDFWKNSGDAIVLKDEHGLVVDRYEY
ncbi:MAG: lamin tail domain-containing protein [bacterium]